MFNKIKSILIRKIVLSKLNVKNLLNLFKYNKKFQKNVNLNLIKYRIFSGRYIISEKNGKCKEYNSFNDELIYDGEYSNGKRGGKGKEYKYGKFIYEGEYFNGKRNGKGKEYYRRKILFEGEYLNGKKWNGKVYDISNNLVYEIKEGKGIIKEFNEFTSKFVEGEYLNGEKNGKGKEYYEKEILFEGKYLNGKKWNGKIDDNSNNLIYELKDIKGFFKNYDENLHIFVGEYLNGEKNGKGKEYEKKYFNI